MPYMIVYWTILEDSHYRCEIVQTDGIMVSKWQPYGKHVVNMRKTYGKYVETCGKHMVNMWWTYGEHVVNMWLTYGEHAVNMAQLL